MRRRPGGPVAVGIVYDQPVDVHFPAHYRDLYLQLLPAHGFDVRFLGSARRPGPVVDEVRVAGGRVVFRPPRRGIVSVARRELGLLAHLGRGLARRGELRDCDVYLVHDNPLTAAVLVAWSRLRRRAFVYRVSHLKPETVLLSPDARSRVLGSAARRLRDALLRRSDGVTTVSPTMADHLLRTARVDPGRLTVVPSCVDAEAPTPAPGEVPRHDRPGITTWAVYAGAVNKARDLTFLLELAEQEPVVAAGIGIAVLGVSADETVLDRLRADITARGLDDRLLLLPPVGDRDLRRTLAAFDVGLSPYPSSEVFRSNSPLKTLDYLMAGLTVVATPNPDQEAVLEATGAGVVAERTPAAFAAGIAAAAAIDLDRDAAREWVRLHRSTEVAARLVEERIGAALSERRPGPLRARLRRRVR